ncbi:MAG TPA: ABC transporter ATP-binding protein [Ktedonobacterales bacterium]|jgi:general nucleoside transport system ATP-binding protein|nr:ABC transporter ATP-binding protein [Ktedonobacterales bacterium]
MTEQGQTAGATRADANELAVDMRQITKIWPGVVANDHVNFSVRKGEIHALVGENGAGKTTLMNILYGLIKPTSGEIAINGKTAQIHSPRDAIGLGIGMVHQHFMLIPVMTVGENITLGYEPVTRGDFYDKASARQQIEELTRRYGLTLDPDARTGDLPVGLQQRVEIVKTLYRGADILILDEPTAVLRPQETDELFGVLRGLAQGGKTIIFITHKLREVMAISDRITVMRRGKVVGHLITSETNEQDIARMMVGRDVLLRVEKSEAKAGPVALNVDHLVAESDRGVPALRDVSFEVHQGEILGIAGVEGNGQSELVEVLAGTRPATGGRVLLGDRDITNLGARTIRKAGVSHIPEDRRGAGLVLNYSVADNLVLGRQRSERFTWRGIVLRLQAILNWAKRLIQAFDIRTPSPEAAARTLSGGNQQKIIVAREMSSEPRLLLAAQPTRGVDIGAIEFIHRRIVEQRDAGAAVLLVSAELDEIRSLADRIAVMYEGRIVSIEPAGTSEERLGLLMTGGGREERAAG